MRVIILPLIAALALSACADHAGANKGSMAVDPPARVSRLACKASAGDAFIGKMVSEEIGAQIMAQSGARSLRWLAPNTAMTMDHRFDRVNVFFDDDRIIRKVSCG